MTILYSAIFVDRLVTGLSAGTAEWLLRCQTYEGGFAGCPNQEAHGGYTFCALAALTLLGQEASCDYRALLVSRSSSSGAGTDQKETERNDDHVCLFGGGGGVGVAQRWACQRQMRCEGGFQGRTNKLVDGCYSFWQGALFPLLQRLLRRLPAARPPPHLADQVPRRRWMFQQRALQHYLLVCCQHPLGGLLDKPGKYVSIRIRYRYHSHLYRYVELQEKTALIESCRPFRRLRNVHLQHQHLISIVSAIDTSPFHLYRYIISSYRRKLL